MSFIPQYPYASNQDNNSINLQFDQTHERILYFDTYFDTDNLLETVGLDFNVLELQTVLQYGYSLDNTNWSQFYIDFQLFKSKVNEQANQGFETYIRIKVLVDKEDERNYKILENNNHIVQIKQVSINGAKARIEKIEVPFADNFVPKKIGTNLYNPYAGMEKATKLWKSISYGINSVVGFYVWYFKVQPDVSSRSISLKSYRLKNVSDLKKIKVLIPDNNIPDNANVFSEYGINFADEMVMHVLDEVFIDAFSMSAGGPQKDDFLYFPLTDRMYSVNSAYPVKEFMQEYVKWQVTLVKYEQTEAINYNTSDDESLNYLENINAWATLQDKNFEMVESFEEIQRSEPDYYNTDVLEATRSALHKDLDIVQFPLYNGALRLFQNWYRLSLVPKGDMAVTYKARDTSPDNLSISFWLYEESISKKKLFECYSDKGNKWLTLTYENSKVTLADSTQTLIVSDITIASKMKYNICVNWSNQFNFCSMIIMEYNDTTKRVTNIHSQNLTINTYSELLNSVKIFGGQHLISAMTVRKRTIDETNARELLLTVQPNSTDVIFHDKCDTVGSEIKSRL